MSKIWQNAGDKFYLQDITNTKSNLELGIYNLQYDNERRLFFLQKIEDRFQFPFKLYGINDNFINTVVKTYNSINRNLGALLNGDRGCGKSVTAKIIANSVNLPVVLISKPYNGLAEFISEIKQDLVLFFDEYDKSFGGNQRAFDDDEDGSSANADPSLLSLMDGSLSGSAKHLFLLTTNRKYVNENMLNRPGRLRYVKEFGNLTIEEVSEIIDDYLIDKSLKDSIIQFAGYLELVTIDIVKSIIEEVNIHGIMPKEFAAYFNVVENDEYYSAILIQNEKEIPLHGKIYNHSYEAFVNDEENGYISHAGYNFNRKGSTEDNIHFNVSVYRSGKHTDGILRIIKNKDFNF